MELREVRPDALDLRLGRLRHLPEVQIRQKLESLKARGQLTPLLVCEQDGALVLVDGFIRHLALIRLGQATVAVEVVHLTTTEMKAQLYIRNRERGFVLLEECRLVGELSALDGLSQTEIGELLLRHKSWVCRRMALVRSLSRELMGDGELFGLGGGSLLKLAQLQVRNQDGPPLRELWAVCRRFELKGSESRQLIELYQKATDPQARAYVLENPKEALKLSRRSPGGTQDTRLGKAGRELLLLLLALRQAGLRVSKRLVEGVEELVPEGRAVLSKALMSARNESIQAFDEVEEFLSKTGGKR